MVRTRDGVLWDSPEWRKGTAVDVLARIGFVEGGKSYSRILFDVLYMRGIRG